MELLSYFLDAKLLRCSQMNLKTVRLILLSKSQHLVMCVLHLYWETLLQEREGDQKLFLKTILLHRAFRTFSKIFNFLV